MRITSSARVLLAAVAVLTCGRARADRGAVTLDLGADGTGLRAGAPFAYGHPAPVYGTAPGGWLGLRYALRNDLELSVAGFYETPVSYFHNGVTITSPQTGPLTGTLTYRLQRYGALAGARYVRGFVWRFVAGLDVGWSHRSYSHFDHIDDVDVPSQPRSYGLALPSFTTDNLVVAPMCGIEWALGDHLSISVLPRLEVLAGPDSTVALTVPVSVGWSWFL